jgi:hypothetical protein
VAAARRQAWAQVIARHGVLLGVRLADRTLQGVTCIRLDVTVTFAPPAGAYSMLFGSGTSTAAEVPTGGGVVVDLGFQLGWSSRNARVTAANSGELKML